MFDGPNPVEGALKRADAQSVAGELSGTLHYTNGMFRPQKCVISTYFTADASNYGNLGDFEISN